MQTPVDRSTPSAYDDGHEAKPMLNFSPFPSPSSRTARLPLTAIRPGKGVENVKSKPFRIGEVTIKPTGLDRWQIRYLDPGSGRDVRRRLAGLGEKEIHAVGIHINRELAEKGGFLPGAPPALPSIAETIAEAIALRNTIPATRRDRAARGAQFVRWLAQVHPAAKRWDQLRPAMVQEYVLGLERRGLAFDSVRLNLAPIKLAWRHAAESWPELVRPLPRIKTAPAPRREIRCLEAKEAAALLDWLRENSPDLWGMATLQALLGLRLLEAAALRVQDVDLGARTLAVTDTGRHKPKTLDSCRVLPLPEEAVAMLRAALDGQRIRPATGELFINSIGNHWTKDALSARWRRALRKAAVELKEPRIAAIPPHRLRATFATTASRLGAPDRLLKAYLGHCAGDVLGGHYRRIEVAELEAVSSRMNAWRPAADGMDFGKFLATVAKN